MTKVIQIIQLAQNVVSAPKQHLKPTKQTERKETPQFTEEQLRLADN